MTGGRSKPTTWEMVRKYNQLKNEPRVHPMVISIRGDVTRPHDLDIVDKEHNNLLDLVARMDLHIEPDRVTADLTFLEEPTDNGVRRRVVKGALVVPWSYRSPARDQRDFWGCEPKGMMWVYCASCSHGDDDEACARFREANGKAEVELRPVGR